MSLPRFLFISAIVIFGGIVTLSLFKGEKTDIEDQYLLTADESVVEIPLELEEPEETPLVKESSIVELPEVSPHSTETVQARRQIGIQRVDRVNEFFQKGKQKLPIVETVTYKSRVPWQKGRPAWLADYAAHYKTSRHFIARSLNGKPDYFKQNISEGDRFNVINPDKDIAFYLAVDTQLCKMWFYYHDKDTDERTLIKTYDVGLGRIDEERESGLLTPLGSYTLGDKIAVYNPGKKGHYNGDKVEMIRVFGTRWIPFEEEVIGCTEPAKGFGIHGIPWTPDEKGNLIEDTNCLGSYSSDGCIRLATKDIEELFAIIITKPTQIEIVHNIADAHLPGKAAQ